MSVNNNAEYLEKAGLDRLVSDIKSYVGTETNKKIDKPDSSVPAGKVLQTDSNHNPIWGDAVPDSSIAAAVSDYLEDKIDPSTAITIDPTLTQTNQAAEAKATGDAIDSLRENLIVVDDEEPTSPDNVVWVEETSLNEKTVAELTELDKVSGSVAPKYEDLTFPIKAGTICTHGYDLYVAKQDIPTIETWTSSHWSTKSNIANQVISLSSAFHDITHVTELVFSNPSEKKYIATGLVTPGNVVDLTPAVSSSYFWKYSITDCVPGDCFMITGTGATSPLLWAFIDVDNKLLAYKSAVGATAENLLVIAPENASKIIVNDRTDSVSYKGYLYTAQETDAKIADGLKVVTDTTGEKTTGLVDCRNGTTNTASGYEKTDFIPIIDGASYYYTGTIVNYAGVAGYDSSKGFVASVLDHISPEGNQTFTDKVLTIPSTVKYIRACSVIAGGVSLLITQKTELQDFVDNTEDRLEVLETVTGTQKPEELFSLSMFEDIAVIGDSFSSGFVSISGTSYTRKNLSWLSDLCRRVGATATHYSTAGLNTETWLENETYGLAKMLSDPAKDLYCIMLGINPEPEEGQAADPSANLGSLSDCNVDYTQNADTCYGRYGRIIGNIKAHAPNGKIFCIVPPSRYPNKKTCIESVAGFYEVPCIDSLDDAFFSNAFYTGNRGAGHPLAISYSGMGLAFERLMCKYIVENPTYFKDYIGS